jgi:hypothetical protein
VDHPQGAHIRTLLKLLKLQFLLKYQLKDFIKIVVAWHMEGSACGVCSGCSVACNFASIGNDKRDFQKTGSGNCIIEIIKEFVLL